MYVLIISLLIISTAALIYFYTVKNNQAKYATNNTIINRDDTSSANDKFPKPKAEIEGDDNETAQANESKAKINRSKVISKTGKMLSEPNKTESDSNNSTNLIETFAGDWTLTDVDPKANSIKGYLKIEAIDGKKATIKSYMQFYYFKTNDTSFLSVFNAFAGCTFCTLEKEMKITAEDVSIGSQTYRILKKDVTGEGKAGDTIMNAGANKSIHASVLLYLINNKNVLIKVQRGEPAELSYGLLLKPFLYTFKFTKVD